MQIFLTEDFTFMQIRLRAPRNARSAAVWIELQLHAIADKHFYSVQTHFTGEVRKSGLAVIELYAKKSVRKRLFDDTFHDLCFSHICVPYNSKKRISGQVF